MVSAEPRQLLPVRGTSPPGEEVGTAPCFYVPTSSEPLPGLQKGRGAASLGVLPAGFFTWLLRPVPRFLPLSRLSPCLNTSATTWDLTSTVYSSNASY